MLLFVPPNGGGTEIIMSDSSFNDLLRQGQSFAIERMHYHKNINMNNTHYHAHYEILYIQNGKRNLKINNSLSYELDSHVIALLRPNTIHRTLAAGDSSQTRILINISQEFVDRLTKIFSPNIVLCFNVPVLKLSAYDAGMLNYLFVELLGNSKDSVLYDDTIKINLSKILLHLSSIYRNTQSDNNDSFVNPNTRDRIDYCVKYIQENFSSDITVSEIAGKLFISETYLERIFKKIMGTTPYNYLLNIRVINAKRLLEARRMSVSEVASACGFNSLMAFSRAFKQIQGCSPKEYQMNYEKM
ncbi:MAG: AraC family transcriptional regulator [Clostridia bacterium]|nr:AraC family transcriptional regulator [Clostridia bacterium]